MGLLQVVPFAKADKDELYTLSAKGVNQYRGNIHTEFTALEQWEREVSLFTSLKRLRTFAQYKLWKGFRQGLSGQADLAVKQPGCTTLCMCVCRSWRDNVCQMKTTRARVALQHDLFMANPILQVLVCHGSRCFAYIPLRHDCPHTSQYD